MNEQKCLIWNDLQWDPHVIFSSNAIFQSPNLCTCICQNSRSQSLKLIEKSTFLLCIFLHMLVSILYVCMLVCMLCAHVVININISDGGCLQGMWVIYMNCWLYVCYHPFVWAAMHESKHFNLQRYSTQHGFVAIAFIMQSLAPVHCWIKEYLSKQL